MGRIARRSVRLGYSYFSSGDSTMYLYGLAIGFGPTRLASHIDETLYGWETGALNLVERLISPLDMPLRLVSIKCVLLYNLCEPCLMLVYQMQVPCNEV